MNRSHLLSISVLGGGFLISLLMHASVFKMDLVSHHVWRQTQTQTVINNYYSGDAKSIFAPKINDKADTDRILRMEFPVMQYAFAQVAKVTGNPVKTARMLTFVMGMFTVLGIWILIFQVSGNRLMALAGAWAFNFSPEFYYFTVNPMPDNFALCCCVWMLALFFKWKNNGNLFLIVLSGIFLMLAILAKLPFVVFGGLPAFYVLFELVKNKNRNLKNIFWLSFIYGILIIPPAIWYMLAVPTWKGNSIVKGIFDGGNLNEVIEFTVYHLLTTLPELLLGYGSLLLFLIAFIFILRNQAWRNSNFFLFFGLGALLILYFLFEINAIRKPHDYYLFPFFPCLFILVGYGAGQLFRLQKLWVKLFLALLLLSMPINAYIRVGSRWNGNSPGLNKDFYAWKYDLRNAVPSDAKCIAGYDPSHFILLYYIDKKGWSYDKTILKQKSFEKWIENGAAYLYTDSLIDTISWIQPRLGKKVMERGTVRVYELK